MERIKQLLSDSMAVKAKMLAEPKSINEIQAIADALVHMYREGGRLFVCGNGGSAADSQHFVTELVSMFEKKDRQPLPALALTTNTSLITAISNDISFDSIFSRQVRAFGNQDDILLVISTSGSSKNILAALEIAQELNMETIGLLGGTGGDAIHQVDYSVVVPDDNTARIQEAHITIIHILCKIIEDSLFI